VHDMFTIVKLCGGGGGATVAMGNGQWAVGTPTNTVNSIYQENGKKL
jgi:hypothetical protein